MTLNTQIIGDGLPIVLIHGLFGSLENLNMVARALAETNQVISVDMRNHGGSPHDQDMTYPLMANDVLAVLDNLGIEQASFLGHSMGGKVAMQFALAFPERVNKLIIADISPVTYQPSHLDIIKGLKSIDLAKVTKRAEADKALAPYVNLVSTRQFLLKNLMFEQGRAKWRCNLNAIAENYPTLLAMFPTTTSFNGDTLFIKGGNSDYILAEHRQTIVSLFPNSKAKIIQGAGHWLHAEKSAAFNKIVRDFLQT